MFYLSLCSLSLLFSLSSIRSLFHSLFLFILYIFLLLKTSIVLLSIVFSNKELFERLYVFAFNLSMCLRRCFYEWFLNHFWSSDSASSQWRATTVSSFGISRTVLLKCPHLPRRHYSYSKVKYANGLIIGEEWMKDKSNHREFTYRPAISCHFLDHFSYFFSLHFLPHEYVCPQILLPNNTSMNQQEINNRTRPDVWFWSKDIKALIKRKQMNLSLLIVQCIRRNCLHISYVCQTCPRPKMVKRSTFIYWNMDRLLYIYQHFFSIIKDSQCHRS